MFKRQKNKSNSLTVYFDSANFKLTIKINFMVLNRYHELKE